VRTMKFTGLIAFIAVRSPAASRARRSATAGPSVMNVKDPLLMASSARGLWVTTKQGAGNGTSPQCRRPRSNVRRPMTTAHDQTFRYYQIGFRCCGEAHAIEPGDSPLASR